MVRLDTIMINYSFRSTLTLSTRLISHSLLYRFIQTIRRTTTIAYYIGYKHIGIFYKPFVAFCYGRLIVYFMKFSWILHFVIVIFIRFYIRNRIRYNKYQ